MSIIFAGVEITVTQECTSQVFYIAESLLQCKAQGFLDGLPSWHKVMPIIHVYIFGEKFDIPELCTEALHQLSKFFEAHLVDLNLHDPFTRKLVTSSVAQEEAKFVYDHTDLASRLRTIFVEHFCAMDTESSCTAAVLCEYPKEFLVDVIMMRAKLNAFLRGVTEAAQRLKKWQRKHGETVECSRN